ncbi:HlyD family efflux transporter periplasmic adaptor subunit [Chitinophaga silvatica]|uniref:HlyD family efflux transporter periplasmic adaptor subunit n=1 Tax=Chitinophaga silvatica TaxID=2282649 RepID=A0A3E1YI42_9BACT|nr:HlyD family efflux transporter periplasmic adaptor subunit [Chitinophaga silvatica]RFS26910.1 HlyD family efflux transporter periplasmic adaptor subunit [Chitinophaga silvatica]
MDKIRIYLFTVLPAILLCGIISCNSKQSTSEENGAAKVVTPVTVTTVSIQPMVDYIELNAISSYLLKSFVKANVIGYLNSGNIQLGQFVQRGQTLFTIKTKEATALGNTINSLDTSFHFLGKNTIRASSSGYITQLDHQPGDYVQDGEQLAVITDKSSFVFLLDMPYDLRPFIANKRSLELTLPDGEKLMGSIDQAMPVMDSATQTQRIIIRVNAGHPIPENLIAKVKIVKDLKPAAVTLPKAAILTDETQTEFWVMKMIDSTTAVKVPVKKGIETNGIVEITDPRFSEQDKILVSGNYGLPDTAHVIIEHK